jgi:hypothetical protein
MKNSMSRSGKLRNLGIITIVGCFFFLCMLAPALYAANSVSLHHICGSKIWIGGVNEIGIDIENDADLTAFRIGFKIYTQGGSQWHWVNHVGGFGPSRAVTVAPDSRMWNETTPDNTVWDDGGLSVEEIDFDGTSPDQLMISGVAQQIGLSAGPSEHMLSLYMVTAYDASEGDFLCIDSLVLIPATDWVFTSAGGDLIPEFSGPFCWELGYLPNCGPEISNCPGSWTMHTAYCNDFLYQFSYSDLYTCSLPSGFTLNGCDGAGTAAVTPSGLFTYTPSADDVGNIVTAEIGISNCAYTGVPCQIEILIEGVTPILDIGHRYNPVVPGETFVKSDITATSEEGCLTPTYSIVSGPGSIDPESGVYTYTTDPGDFGIIPIQIEVADVSGESAPGEFALVCLPEELWPGNANMDGSYNISDGVYIVDYIFKGGPKPWIPNWADANCDCTVNISDAVRIINNIFKGGEAPVMGCVE